MRNLPICPLGGTQLQPPCVHAMTRVCAPRGSSCQGSEHLVPLCFWQHNVALTEQPLTRSLSHSFLEDRTTIRLLRRR